MSMRLFGIYRHAPRTIRARWRRAHDARGRGAVVHHGSALAVCKTRGKPAAGQRRRKNWLALRNRARFQNRLLPPHALARLPRERRPPPTAAIDLVPPELGKTPRVTKGLRKMERCARNLGLFRKMLRYGNGSLGAVGAKAVSLRVFGCLPRAGARGCTEAGVRKPLTNVVGCANGRSAGLAPLKIRSGNRPLCGMLGQCSVHTTSTRRDG